MISSLSSARLLGNRERAPRFSNDNDNAPMGAFAVVDGECASRLSAAPRSSASRWSCRFASCAMNAAASTSSSSSELRRPRPPPRPRPLARPRPPRPPRPPRAPKNSRAPPSTASHCSRASSSSDLASAPAHGASWDNISHSRRTSSPRPLRTTTEVLSMVAHM